VKKTEKKPLAKKVVAKLGPVEKPTATPVKPAKKMKLLLEQRGMMAASAKRDESGEADQQLASLPTQADKSKSFDQISSKPQSEAEVSAPPAAPEKRSMTAVKKSTMTDYNSGSKQEKLFIEAGRLRDQGKLAPAIDLLKQLLLKDSNHGRARRRLARIYVEQGKVAQSLELLREGVFGRSSVQLAKEEPNLAAFLAALYQRESDHWQAIDLYENLLRLYPDKGVWRMGLAISLERVNEPDDALRAYTLALDSEDLSNKLRTFINKRIRKLK
jgi:tetratricopeptide (TPR) repeat protein